MRQRGKSIAGEDEVQRAEDGVKLPWIVARRASRSLSQHPLGARFKIIVDSGRPYLACTVKTCGNGLFHLLGF